MEKLRRARYKHGKRRPSRDSDLVQLQLDSFSQQQASSTSYTSSASCCSPTSSIGSDKEREHIGGLGAASASSATSSSSASRGSSSHHHHKSSTSTSAQICTTTNAAASSSSPSKEAAFVHTPTGLASPRLSACNSTTAAWASGCYSPLPAGARSPHVFSLSEDGYPSSGSVSQCHHCSVCPVLFALFFFFGSPCLMM